MFHLPPYLKHHLGPVKPTPEDRQRRQHTVLALARSERQTRRHRGTEMASSLCLRVSV
ncbi:MAG: hypothetical protein AVDCRST_MAG68-1584 [uncultured Gemmatimonadetes bacterium]|uniref:Uncharacterized protein n=1 Tax=uncultured Gemmatimonadota bacterium TaxID=203437 RepID=A0A6J4KWN3_9BACT|nr:MAG: hypothetical protein AVDCRST_MAG68-1584 [uncultured Gemmatimonadota bacterium]